MGLLVSVCVHAWMLKKERGGYKKNNRKKFKIEQQPIPVMYTHKSWLRLIKQHLIAKREGSKARDNQ